MNEESEAGFRGLSRLSSEEVHVESLSPCRTQGSIGDNVRLQNWKGKKRGGGDRKGGCGRAGRENGDCYISSSLGRSSQAEKAEDGGDKETSAVSFQKTEERHAFGERLEGSWVASREPSFELQSWHRVE